MLSVKKELKIYRGTYEEIVALETEDMAIYLAWDTQEIFVGNKYGVKTPYIGGNRLSEREIRLLFGELTDAELETLRSQILATNIKALANETGLAALTVRVETLEGTNNDEIVQAVTDILTAEGGALSNYYTKVQADTKIAADISTYTYSKSQIDLKLPDIENFSADYTTLKGRVDGLETADDQFNSVKVLDPNSISESQLLEYINASEDGIYSFKTSAGYEFLIINGSTATRLKPEGRFYQLVSGSWEIVAVDEAIIKSINSLTTTDGTISIDLDDIPETATKKYNSLLPQSGNAVNPVGRNSSYTVGDESVSFGYNSAAQGVSSVALGSGAVATGEDSVQIGTGSNTSDGTLKFMDYELLNSSGKIPNERITETFGTATVVIATADWNEISKEVIKSVSGISSSSIVWVSPAEVSISNYSRSNVRAMAQGTDTLTFKCDLIPSASISVSVVWRS